MGEGEVEHYDVAAEEDVADEDFGHVVVGLHAGGVDLGEGGGGGWGEGGGCGCCAAPGRSTYSSSVMRCKTT